MLNQEFLFSAPQVYAITDPDLLPGEKLYRAVEHAIMGGCRWIQYRNKTDLNSNGVMQARILKSICDAQNATLVINDSLELALGVGATALHLGQGDGDVANARRQLGDSAIIGVTCHDSLALAEKAVNDGASYIAFGRFFLSQTKPNARPAPISLIAEARKRFPNIPIAVIGGIDLHNVSPLVAEGANLIAVCNSLFAAPNITHQTELFFKTINAAHQAASKR